MNKKTVKRRFKPKKPADIKDEPAETESPAAINEVKHQTERKSKQTQKQQQQRPKKERKYTQIKGVLDASGVEQRGTQSRWGSKPSGQPQMRAPAMKQTKQVWTKLDVKEEQEETTNVLSQLADSWIVDDQSVAELESAPDLWPIKVGESTKDIDQLRDQLTKLQSNDDAFLRALEIGDSDEIFLLQMSDLPIVPPAGTGDIDSDDEYDPNEELLIGHIELNGDRCVLKTNDDIGLQIHSGSSAKFAQELARVTTTSFQSVGEVKSKLLLTPDMNELINAIE